LRKRGSTLVWQHNQTIVGAHVARVSRPVHHVTALFFIFGFITNLNMALVPHLKAIFTLPYAWAMLAESAFFLAYFVFSAPTSKAD
jgi:FHS family L-fucose permease-like MFS transporter